MDKYKRDRMNECAWAICSIVDVIENETNKDAESTDTINALLCGIRQLSCCIAEQLVFE